jgi:RNA methyltransferase, TrmH family
VIVSRDNERLKLVRKLHERRWRDKLGLFFVEGEDLVSAATAQPVDVLRAGEDVEPKLLAEIGTAGHPPRVIAVYRRDDLPSWEERPVTLALWRLSDPGNVGTLIRTADAFGAAVALSDGSADPASPKALRASAGSIWRVPIGRWASNTVLQAPRQARREADPRQVDASNTVLQALRVALVAHGGRPLDDVALSGHVAFLLGAEREGLPAEVERDVEATIPLAGAESLNVAAAGAIALYEWRRQTQTESSPPRQGERSNQP